MGKFKKWAPKIIQIWDKDMLHKNAFPINNTI